MPGSVGAALNPVFNEADLVLESVVVGLGSGSVWGDLDAGFSRASQKLGTTGVNLVSGSAETGSVGGWARSLASQKSTWKVGPLGTCLASLLPEVWGPD